MDYYFSVKGYRRTNKYTIFLMLDDDKPIDGIANLEIQPIATHCNYCHTTTYNRKSYNAVVLN